jgi:hypothetical protein
MTDLVLSISLWEYVPGFIDGVLRNVTNGLSWGIVRSILEFKTKILTLYSTALWTASYSPVYVCVGRASFHSYMYWWVVCCCLCAAAAVVLSRNDNLYMCEDMLGLIQINSSSPPPPKTAAVFFAGVGGQLRALIFRAVWSARTRFFRGGWPV